jgi:hypothetical protein
MIFKHAPLEAKKSAPSAPFCSFVFGCLLRDGNKSAAEQVFVNLKALHRKRVIPGCCG